MNGKTSRTTFLSSNLPVAVAVACTIGCAASAALAIAARIFALYYFAFFFIILPVLGFMEKTKPLPRSISNLYCKTAFRQVHQYHHLPELDAELAFERLEPDGSPRPADAKLLGGAGEADEGLVAVQRLLVINVAALTRATGTLRRAARRLAGTARSAAWVSPSWSVRSFRRLNNRYRRAARHIWRCV